MIISVADFMSSDQRSAHMAKIRSKNTKPEVLLRSSLHRAGYRFRLHARYLPGRPDLVFPSRRKVIFVNGCFWHGHSCQVGSRLPKTNTEFWRVKREKNQDRDTRQRAELATLGWDAFTIWECELESGSPLGASLAEFLGPPGSQATRSRVPRNHEKG